MTWPMPDPMTDPTIRRPRRIVWWRAVVLIGGGALIAWKVAVWLVAGAHAAGY